MSSNASAAGELIDVPFPQEPPLRLSRIAAGVFIGLLLLASACVVTSLVALLYRDRSPDPLVVLAAWVGTVVVPILIVMRNRTRRRKQKRAEFLRQLAHTDVRDPAAIAAAFKRADLAVLVDLVERGVIPSTLLQAGGAGLTLRFSPETWHLPIAPITHEFEARILDDQELGSAGLLPTALTKSRSIGARLTGQMRVFALPALFVFISGRGFGLSPVVAGGLAGAVLAFGAITSVFFRHNLGTQWLIAPGGLIVREPNRAGWRLRVTERRFMCCSCGKG